MIIAHRINVGVVGVFGVVVVSVRYVSSAEERKCDDSIESRTTVITEMIKKWTGGLLCLDLQKRIRGTVHLIVERSDILCFINQALCGLISVEVANHLAKYGFFSHYIVGERNVPLRFSFRLKG